MINAFSASEQVKGTTLTLRLTNVRNSPSLQTRTGFIVNTMSQDGNYINKCSGISMSLSKSYVQSSASGSSVALSGNTAPGKDGTYQFTFQTTLPVPNNGSLHLTMPDEISLPSVGINSVSVTSSTNLDNSVQLITGSSNKVLVFQNGFSGVYVGEGSQIVFTIQYFKNPDKNTSTGSFQIETFDEAGFAIESLKTGLTIQAESGSLQDLTFLPVES